MTPEGVARKHALRYTQSPDPTVPKKGHGFVANSFSSTRLRSARKAAGVRVKLGVGTEKAAKLSNSNLGAERRSREEKMLQAELLRWHGLLIFSTTIQRGPVGHGVGVGRGGVLALFGRELDTNRARVSGSR